MKRVLKSQFHDSFWTSSKGEIYKIKTLPIKPLWPSVPKCEEMFGKPFYETVKNDIEQDGLIFPIITVYTRRKELLNHWKKYSELFNELPFSPDTDDTKKKLWIVWGGSNRVRIAEDLGYTHIDCVIIPDINTANLIQSDMRSPFKNRYYTTKRVLEKNRVTSV